MNWDLTGHHVNALYLSQYYVSGIVRESRVAYGVGRIKHHITLDAPIEIYGTLRESLTVEHDEICM